MPHSHGPQLDSTKSIVQRVMKTKGAKLLFNKPVDPVADNVPDYPAVISHPIDLGTIYKRLEAGQKNNWDLSSYYRKAEDVFEEVSRVWKNCYTYNNGPNDAPVREVCRKTELYFEARWNEAGLPRDEATERQLSDEAQVPEHFSLRKESVELPVRFLNHFCIRCRKEPTKYIALEDVTSGNVTEIQAVGHLVVPDESKDDAPYPLCLDVLVDWCFQYGSLPGIWLITHYAWYKLLNPAEYYIRFLSGTLHKFMMSLSVINRPDTDSPFRAESSLSDDMGGDSPSIPDEIVEIIMEDDSFKEETLRSVPKHSLSCSKTTKEDNGMSAVADSAASTFSQETNESPRSQEATVKTQRPSQRSLRSNKSAVPMGRTHEKCVMAKLGNREKSTSRKKQRIQSPLPVNEMSVCLSEMDEDDPLFDPSCDVDTNIKEDEDEDYIHESGKRHRSKKAAESEAQKTRREKKAQEQLRKEQEADRRRGSPPPVTSHFRTPQELIGMALSCWNFLMTFHVRLELPPFPFWRFEAALCPMYCGNRRNEIKYQLMRDPKSAVQDAQGKASALLLQDIHVALCRVIQGRAPFVKETPTHATMDVKASSTPHWTQSTSLLLLKSHAEDVDEQTRSAAAFLHGHEYLDLTVHAKLKILCTLVDMVVSTDVFREHLNSLVDKLTVQKQQSYEEKPLNVAVLESMSLSFERKAANLSVEKWSHWFSAHKLGVLSTLGQDFKGNHYWALGDVSGCYRIYVENRLAYEQSLSASPAVQRSRNRGRSDGGIYWGWYEGESIAQFIDWLAKGELECEKSLLEAMRHIPKPVQLERNRSLSDTSTLNIISLGYHKLEPSMLEAFRMDGYSDVRFPLLRGEGEIATPPGEVHPAERVSTCVRALLSAIPFWEKDTDVHIGICSLLDKIANAQETAVVSKEVCRMMEEVCDHGTVREEWKSLRKAWECSLRECPSLHGIIAHLTLFQSFVHSPAHSVHRLSFNVMVQDAKCPLYFPMPSEQVVFLRTGCLAHLERYLEVSHPTLAAPTAASCFRQSTHPEVVSAAQRRAEQLSPVEYFRVCCISYRSPYPDAPPEGTAMAEDTSLPVQPCMWLLMASLEDASKTIVLPIHVDNALPDYIVKISAFEQSRKTKWKTGDRFKMFFGGKSLTRGSSGIYYKGTISGVKQPVQGEAYDPWESLTVEWDNDHSGASMKVSPWEIEVDPEEQKKLEEARMRQMESRSRQARAMAKQQRTEYLADMVDADDVQSVGDPDYDPLADIEGGKPSGRPRRRGSALQELVYYDPKNPSGPVPSELMALLPGPYEFPILIHNFMQRLKGKFKCPVFSGKDLDLYKVFHEVQQRGGYDVVTSVKLWKDVCRTLNVNLKGQTSASYNMRLNYEKCLLDFEHYLSSGRYGQELKDGSAPSCSVYEPYPQKLRGIELETPVTRRTSSSAGDGDQMTTRGARRQHRNVTMTQLLMGETSATEWNGQRSLSTAQKRSESERVISPTEYKRAPSAAMAAKETPFVVPLVTQGSASEFENPKKLRIDQRDPVEIQPGESIGMALDRLGWALIGCQIWRRLPDQIEWRKAEVSGFNRRTNEHRLTCDKGKLTEQSEWVDLRELEGEELSQQDPTPVKAAPSEPRTAKSVLKTPTADRNELSHLLTPPRALQRYGAEKTTPESVTSLSAASRSGMKTMDWFRQILSSEMNPEILKQIVDDDAIHRIYEEATQDHLGSLGPQGQFSQTPSSVQLESLLSNGIVRPSTVPRANERTGPFVRLPHMDRQNRAGSKRN